MGHVRYHAAIGVPPIPSDVSQPCASRHAFP